ncbi:unnamed protein product [Tetraodon nigroviridis]|uniref:(spotted green pufferfish) hypothetical protein n=1 Tax=Tetraodon nigroviridis TaxID=99883 RepID=Q4RPV5_TETNG|nr:unnamed protein product [Tetraodon nigroviridis]
MDLKVVAVLFLLSAFAISSSEAGIPRCCTSTRKGIHPKDVMKVVGWNLQRSGACDIDAVVLLLKNKRRMCLDWGVFKAVFPAEEKRLMKKRTAK